MHTPLDRVAKRLRAYVWERAPEDFYIEDQWVSARLFQSERFPLRKIHDPFCGSGRVLHAALNHGCSEVSGSDIVKRPHIGRFKFRILDATGVAASEMLLWDRHIVSNPPYRLVDHILELMIQGGLKSKCALFMRLTAIAGKASYLKDTPLARVWICKPRPNCLPGDLVMKGVKPGGGQVDFAWLVFDPKHSGDPVLRYLNKSNPTDFH